MATWEDGPEYAPIERPDEFAVPEAPPLSIAEPYVQPAADAPVDRPFFGDPQAPVRPLAALVPLPEDPRDPTIPYEVVAGAMTTGDSAWGSVHSSPPTSPITTTGSPWLNESVPVGGSTPWGMPFGTPPSPGAQPFGPPAGGAAPAPGTPQWFGPAPYVPPPAPVPVTAKDVLTAVTPALLIVLALGALIHPVAPMTLLIAWGLSTRCTVAKPQIRTAFVIAVATVAVLGLVIGFAGALDFADWWNGLSWVAMVAAWCVIAAVLALATRALRSGQRPWQPPGGPRPGGPGGWA
ncbi:hypothetical protein [Microlunatus ginsengisoli]|uniref:Uncharacterized protein n=1 Tax=Microlunatus ginsengisoli TaxID=363863 RepID=A0ABP7AW78_9ACTN